MSSVAINLTLAILLLAANAFYVAAEFALVKSRGYRVNAMTRLSVRSSINSLARQASSSGP